MKGIELRIGNLIQTTSKGKVCEILSLGQYELRIVSEGKNISTWRYDLIEPIELTQEWGLKFGFEKNGTNIRKSFPLASEVKLHVEIFKGSGFRYVCLEKQHDIEYTATKSFTYIPIHGECMYVHQLQNLWFALTGHELKR